MFLCIPTNVSCLTSFYNYSQWLSNDVECLKIRAKCILDEDSCCFRFLELIRSHFRKVQHLSFFYLTVTRFLKITFNNNKKLGCFWKPNLYQLLLISLNIHHPFLRFSIQNHSDKFSFYEIHTSLLFSIKLKTTNTSIGLF